MLAHGGEVHEGVVHVLFHQMMLLFMQLLQLTLMMVLRLMGHQNQYDHDDSTSNGMKSA